MSAIGITRETVAIAGPRGTLRGELAYGDRSPHGSALVVGPHPYMGGTMENNVVSWLAHALASEGWTTLRFDYGEVPATDVAASVLAFWQTGHAPQDGELVGEAGAARDWLSVHMGGPGLILGYSFGAHVASEIARDSTRHLVFIAPTVKQHDLPALQTCRIPKLVIYSTDDFATTQLSTEAWYEGLAAPKTKRCYLGGEHFFRGMEAEIVRDVLDFVNQPAAMRRDATR